MTFSAARTLFAAFPVAWLLISCGGGGGNDTPTGPPPPPPTYTIGGTVAGLAGTGLTLQNSGGADLALSANGAFTFPVAQTGGAAYAVTVHGQPSSPSQTCSVTNGTGTVGNLNVTNVAVTCTTNIYSVGGTVSGLVGSGLELEWAPGSAVSVTGNGAFTFSAVPSGATYNVVVKSPPTLPLQTCTIANGGGSVGSSDVTNISVTCVTNTFSVGGTIAGLNGTGLILRNNGVDPLAVAANGSFVFPQSILSGGAYAVTVSTQPSGPPQKCTVAGANGTVTSAGITNVVVTCANTYSLGGTVSGLTGSGFVLQNNAGDDVAIGANGAFSFATLVPVGSTYDVTVKAGPTHPVQTCSITGASGTMGNAAVANVAVNCQTDQFAYVTNQVANTISIYTINSVTGALTPAAGSPFAQAGGPVAMAFDATNKFAYVVNHDGPSVSAFAVDATTGMLTLIGDEPAAAAPGEIAIDPLGRYVYVSSAATQFISAYLVDATTGALGTPAGFPKMIGDALGEMVMDATGNYLYAVNQSSGSLNGFLVNPVDASFFGTTPGSPYVVGTTPLGVTLDPANDFLYVVNNGIGAVSAFSLDDTTGALTPLAGSPFAATAAACSMTIDPQDRFAFVPNSVVGSPGSLSTFSKAATGVLTQVAGSPVAAGASPCSAAVDPSGRFVFVANQASGNVSGYSIDQTTGALTQLPGSPYAAGAGASTIVTR